MVGFKTIKGMSIWARASAPRSIDKIYSFIKTNAQYLSAALFIIIYPARKKIAATSLLIAIYIKSGK